jgi:hypothetical protein
MIQNETASTAQTLDLPPVDSPSEAQLGKEIAELWHDHKLAHTSVRKTQNELKAIRTTLSKRLHELKSLLSRPGRGGTWSSFLSSQRIPRSTGDRLVRGYEKTLTAERENRTTGQISEPTEVTVRRYLQGLWPRLSRILTTREAVELFIEELKHVSDKSFSAHQGTPPGP